MTSNYSETALQQAYEKAFKAYVGRENVTGIDIGYRYTDGQKTDDIVVRIHVREKISESNLETAEIFPSEIDGVPVDVIQAIYRSQDALESTFERQIRRDRIQPGLSISHPNVTAGTFGAVVYDNISGRSCILSNWHVLVGSSSASAGDPILQPGSLDGGRLPNDRIGQLERSIIDRDGDAAIALLDDRFDRSIELSQFETGVTLRSARSARIGEVLEKSGRTTGVTRGRVDGYGSYTIEYSVGAKTIDGFKIVSVDDGNPNNGEVSSGGDSGSVWYSLETQEGVGLHFAGEVDPNPRSEHAIACHLPRVLTALNVSLSPPAFESSSAFKKPEEMQIVVETLQQVIQDNLSIPYEDIATSPLAQNFYRFDVDGIYGKITREALRDFKVAYALSDEDVLGPTTAKALLRLDTLSADETYDFITKEETIRAIIQECQRQGLTLNTQIAYVLATVEHETADTFKPVREAFWLSEDYRRRNLWYYPYYGRGYVQLTHKANYQTYSRILGIDLIGNPDKVMEPKIALFILVDGMAKGRFTGKYLGQFINVNSTDFVGARRMVSGTDRSHHIANLAQNWLSKISSFKEELETIDNDTPIELEDIGCEAPDHMEAATEAVPFPQVNVQLPLSGQGYYSYAAYRYKQFGLPKTIQAIQAIGSAWFSKHRTGPLIGIGNISINGGGPVPPHSSHQRGVDVDFRLLRSDGARVGVSYQDPAYSQSRTQELVNTIRANSVLQVDLILFNDPGVRGVQHWPGHDDHLHVRFK
jgi:peptidoglycan hydrolase-like protein with peptidoglycan-binding domain